MNVWVWLRAVLLAAVGVFFAVLGLLLSTHLWIRLVFVLIGLLYLAAAVRGLQLSRRREQLRSRAAQRAQPQSTTSQPPQ